MSEDFRYTYSVKREGGEMFVIRSNDETELLDLRGSLKASLDEEAVVSAESRKKDYKHEGDHCPQDNGTLVKRNGTNRGNGNAFEFLGCSNFPRCDYTAYISKYAKKEEVVEPA